MLNKIMKLIKNICRPVAKGIGKFLFKYRLDYVTRKTRKKYKKCIFLVATPCHGNLGDHAIVYAQYKLLADIGMTNQLIEITNREYLNYNDIFKANINKDDMIIVDGGGNLGTLWPNEDDKISQIINDYSNKIIIFPQTCFYTKDTEGEKRLEKNNNIYRNHKDLTICLRDKASYDFFRASFPLVKSLYVPDIVLYIDDIIQKNNERDGVLLCFRKDLEKVIPNHRINQLKEFLKSKKIPFSETDTVIKKAVTQKRRHVELSKKWNEFSSAGLIITDRLHGMIFAAITATPCLAIDNKSKKVSGVYRWISSLDYIRVCNDVDEITNQIFDLYKLESGFDFSIIKKDFEEVILELKRGHKNGTI